MIKKNFFYKYFKDLSKIFDDESNFVIFEKVAKEIIAMNKKGGKLIIVGNGGSSAIASHASVDFTKAAGIRAINFNESDLLTCFSNDYGYENWVKKALEFYVDKDDVVFLISSSGKSKNILNGAKFLKKKKIKLITFSGFSDKNDLKKLGNYNLYCNSNHYNYVENTHQIWILSIVDYIISKRKN
ncbi:MAG: SIS domain-containing protein [Sphingomonadales bacterium]|nr:SIS domain-containing protein [Sphingomonadales bacterium]